MTTPPAGPQNETKEAAVRGGAPAALREAAEAILEPLGHPFYGQPAMDGHTVGSIPSIECGECSRLRTEREHRLQRALSENTVGSLDEHVPSPGRWAFLMEDTGDWIEVKPGVVFVLAATAASDAAASATSFVSSEEETNG